MINYRIIARVFSILLIFEGLLMLLSALISYIYYETTTSAFIYSAFITILAGIGAFVPLREEEKVYGNREGYIIVTGVFLIFSLFGTLPYLFSGSITSFPDAFFESVSGFTTTGATIITDVDSMSKGILFWRSMTQWVGGLCIIFLSLYVLPVFRDINIQLSTTDFSGQTSDKIHPRTIDAVKRLIGIYIALTIAEALLLFVSGMTLFDAVCHSFTTLSTGGFTTHNNSLAFYSSPLIKVVITIFMFIAGTNMTIIYFGINLDFRKLTENDEYAFYAIICLIFSLIAIPAIFIKSTDSLGNSILDGFFHVVSIVSTTGYYTSDYTSWGSFMIMIFFILMFTGGTSGSTSGGMKVSRLLILTKNNRTELRRLIHPDAFIPVRLNRRILPQSIVYNVLVFVTLYFLVLCISSVILSFMGYDIITSFSTSAAFLGNIGPGMGTFAPFTNYATLPVTGKWFLSGLMLLGRLELITVMILFARSFFRK